MPEDTAVQMAMQHTGLQDLTASLRGQPSHLPPQPGSADSRIDLCYPERIIWYDNPMVKRALAAEKKSNQE